MNGARPPASRRARGKAATHQRIVRSASRLIRRAGLTAASVPRVMGGAGLTVGGFYAHFRSKRAMDAEVLAGMLEDVRNRWFTGIEERRDLAGLARAVRRYLSASHRDDVAGGCALPATISELTRADRTTRIALSEAVEAAVEQLAARAPDGGAVTPRERALAIVALCVGGLTLSRALRGLPASDELLRACVRWALPELEGE